MSTVINTGDTALLLVGGALVFIMTPGLGFFYGGMARQKHFLSTITSSMLAVAVVTVQWFLFGYSLTFSVTGGSFIGNFDHAVMWNVGMDPHPNAPTCPANAYFFYQLMFAIITPALAFGGGAERATMHAFMIFVFVWSTLVYNFVAYWTWNPNGWLFKLGALDFAGGGPVHLASGSAALAYALILGKREGYGKEPFRPHNLAHVILGTTLLWFGWFGFNGVSELSSNARSANAMIVTHIAASVGGLWWIFMEFIFATRKLSSLGFCSGAVVGLVAITPASGYVTPGGAFAIGVVGVTLCFAATHIKNYIQFDDAFDVFAIHAVGGAAGSVLTGIFADDWVWSLNPNDTPNKGGWVSNYYEIVGFQLAGILAIGTWSFVMSYIILFVMQRIPGMGVRVSAEQESMGTDLALLGEIAYRQGSIRNIASDKNATSPNVEFSPIEPKEVTKEDGQAQLREGGRSSTYV